MLGSATRADGAITREIDAALVAAVAMRMVASTVAVRVVGPRVREHDGAAPAA